ncbi:MAG: helix-turn-helix domain-containing protein [Elusimicrobiota bacterium]
MEKRFLSPKELSEYLGLAVGTVYHLVAQRNIPFYKFGKSVRFSIEEINKWADDKRKDSILDF